MNLPLNQSDNKERSFLKEVSFGSLGFLVAFLLHKLVLLSPIDTIITVSWLYGIEIIVLYIVARMLWKYNKSLSIGIAVFNVVLWGGFLTYVYLLVIF